MNGQTCLILRDLQNGLSPKDVAKKFDKAESSIYKLVRRYNIELPKKQPLTLEEKKLKKQRLDAKRYEKEKLHKLERPDIYLPALPMVAAKFGALSSLNAAWQLKQGFKRSSVKEGRLIQTKYGLKSLIGQ